MRWKWMRFFFLHSNLCICLLQYAHDLFQKTYLIKLLYSINFNPRLLHFLKMAFGALWLSAIQLKINIKVSPLQAMKAQGECGGKFRHNHTPGKFPGTHFKGGWVDSRASLDTKDWRKISTPKTHGIEPGASSPWPSRLSHLAVLLLRLRNINSRQYQAFIWL